MNRFVSTYICIVSKSFSNQTLFELLSHIVYTKYFFVSVKCVCVCTHKVCVCVERAQQSNTSIAFGA